MVLITLQKRGLPLLWATALVFVGGCARPVDEKPSADSSSGPPSGIRLDQPPTEAQKAQMIAAKDVLFAKLSGRLMEVIGSQGPAAAIAVCKSEAPQIAESVGQQEGVKIGRTALKLRNPGNQPPAWAASLLDESRDQPTFLTLEDGRGAALLPIKLKALCLMCHGPADQIMPQIKGQLATLYPDDRATGFREGDLRGWFWVETQE